ncbi:MAG: hypothetical protein GYA24_25860, partial [Candidatus Lokiarchaeota archaeon]|nr:hypothetical protein [Candidatus Lokiarchaeota archaeon]
MNMLDPIHATPPRDVPRHNIKMRHRVFVEHHRRAVDAMSSSSQQQQASLVKVLKRALGKRVLVVLKRAMEINGILRGFDQHL